MRRCVVFSSLCPALDSVGYNTVTIRKDYNMLSVNFKDVSNTEGVGIQELFLGTGDAKCPFKGYTNTSQADQIKVYVNDGETTADYITYYLYYNSKQTTNVKNYKWCKASDNSAVSGNILNPGFGAWYKRYGDTSMTLDIKNQFSK